MQHSRTQTLESTPIFSSLNKDELNELAALANERCFMSNKFIFWEGDEARWFYILTEGQVKVIKHSSSGKEFVIAFFGPGEMFGEVAVFEDKPYPASSQAVTKTRVLEIKKDDFLSFLANHPRVALKIINVLGGRLRDAQNRLRDLASERVEQRLAGILLMLSSKLGTTLPFTRQDIANMAGTTTETTIRVMTNLKNRGIIRSSRGQIVITNQEKLKLLSEGPPQV
ncbi:MAG: Crp/Fnr family transcriptional regulator [Dehalococcoidales bacterium]|nr:Crp/Fnr family transcriptional regulator [Dehalococcoidales bacterium]